MVGALFERMMAASHEPAIFGLTVLVHSTVVLIVGLTGLKALEMKGTGAGARSVFLRVCLCVAMATPVTAALSKYFHMPRFHITAPITETAPVKHAPAADIPAKVRAPRSPQPAAGRKTMPPAVAIPRSPVVQSTHDTSAPVPRTNVKTPAFHVPAFHIPAGIPAFLLVFAWAALSLFLAFRAGVVSLYYRRMRALSEPADGCHSALCRSVAGELSAEAPPVLKNRYVNGAFITGLFHPAVMIPSGDQEPVMTTREVFLHEIAHVVRHDHVWLYIGHLGTIILPLQPLMWMLVHAIEETNDFACDDYVLQTTGKQHAYAKQLVDLAVSMRPYPIEARAGTGIFTRGTHLRRRIDYILDTSLARRFKPDAVESVSFTLLFLCTLTFTGLVGVRGKPFEQIRTLSEIVSRKAATVAFAAAVVKEQVRTALTPPGRTEKSPVAEESVMDEASEIPGTALPATADTLPAVLIPETEAEVHANTGTILLADAGAREPDPAIENITATIPSPVTMPSITADTPIVKPASQPAQKSETQVSPAPAPALFGLHSAATGRTETAAVKAGQLKITVPPETPAALRESIELGQENPVWSPSGNLIAFTGRGGNGIWAVSAHGGRPVLVYDNSGDIPAGVTSPRGNARILCFTPGGEEITYLRYTAKTAGSVASKEAAMAGSSLMPIVESVSLKTGARREIVRDASDGCWSPDGRYFAYVEGDYYGVSVLDTTTGLKRKISNTGKSLSITPDGSFIVYSDWGGGQTDQLFRAPIGGGKPEQLTGEGIWWNPKCSPDGEWIICSGGIVYFGAYARLQAYNTRTHGVCTVYSAEDENLDIGGWSPDGRQFCYTRYSGVYENGKNIRKSTIHIEDFNIRDAIGRAASVAAEPSEFKLIGNFPNPFNPSTTIRFSLASEGRAELVIYNMAGQVVRELVSRSLPSGMHSVVWDGRDRNGRPVSSGTYISRLKMEGKVESRRMTLVK